MTTSSRRRKTTKTKSSTTKRTKTRRMMTTMILLAMEMTISMIWSQMKMTMILLLMMILIHRVMITLATKKIQIRRRMTLIGEIPMMIIVLMIISETMTLHRIQESAVDRRLDSSPSLHMRSSLQPTTSSMYTLCVLVRISILYTT